jgi:cobalt-zinc-cadmium efflux system outer membrane protein
MKSLPKTGVPLRVAIPRGPGAIPTRPAKVMQGARTPTVAHIRASAKRCSRAVRFLRIVSSMPGRVPPPRNTRWLAPLLALTSLVSSTLAAGDVGMGGLSMLVDEALAQNPSLESMRDRTRELGELAEVANAWQDPLLSVELLNVPVDTFSIDDTPMAGVQLKLQQRLPEWGWTRAAKAVAEHRVEQSRHARAEAEVQLRRSVETLYWNLARSRLLELVTQEHLARTIELIRAVRARYEVGKTGQNALLRLAVLRDRLRDDLGDYRRAERTLSAGLSRALSRTPDHRFETPSVIEPISPEGNDRIWMEIARQNRPELDSIREEIKQQEKAATLSRIRVRPEVDVWVKYRIRTFESPTDDGTDFFSAGVSLPIPWGSAKRGLRGEAASMAARDGASARLAAALDRIEAELIEVDASWRRAAEKSSTYGGTLIPAARTALATTLSDFSVGKAEFATLYEAEVDLLVLERSYLSATIETHIQRAAARAMTGRSDLERSS